MGTGSSTGQGRNTTYGTRDARRYSAETSYWPELAGAKLAESSGTGRNPYSVAQRVGPRSSLLEEDGCSGSTEDNARSGANARFVPEVRNPDAGPSSSTSTEHGVYDSIAPNSAEERQNSSTAGAASSDEEDNGVQTEDDTLRRRRTTLAEIHGSKSSLLDAGTRELAGPPANPLPSTSAQELAERVIEEPLEELGRLAAELNHRLELQKQKKKRGCGPTDALWGPPAVRPVSRGGPRSGSYEPQVVRPKLEQEANGSGPSDSVSYVRNERETPSVIRPRVEHGQQNNAYNNTGNVYSNGVSATSDVSGMRYPARGEGQTILSPVTGQTQSNFREERKQAEGKSMLQSAMTEQPSAVPTYEPV